MMMVRLLGVLALGSLAAADDSFATLGDDAQSLLQTRASVLRSQRGSCAPIRKYYDPNNRNRVVAEWCWMNVTNPDTLGPGGPQQEHDLDRPLADVQREHPGNLYSYFGHLNQWMSPGIVPLDGRGYAGYKEALTIPTLPFTDGKGRAVTFTWDGLQITTHMDTCQAGDDPYCYSLGWMQGQALDKEVNMASLMNNATAWSNLGISECRRMKEEFGFKDQDITLGGHIRETNDMYVKTERTCDWHEPSPGPPATVRDFKKHAYAKCFMNNVTTEMAYCYFRGCVMGNNNIGHASQCTSRR